MYIGGVGQHEIKQQLLMQGALLILEEKFAREGGQLLDWQNERELRREYYSKLATTKKSGVKTKEPTGIADARLLIQSASGAEKLVAIECDGYYYRQMLQTKLAELAQLNCPVLYVTVAGRVASLTPPLSTYPSLELLVVAPEYL
jgi:hypothetical protein